VVALRLLLVVVSTLIYQPLVHRTLNRLPAFPVPCRLFENFAFMVGSAYFVAGSYPDESMLIADDFLDTSVDESEGGFYLT
jgi:hypothetical protein